ncbi:10902_t:CDS:2, partial [Cetraspora pellucida]
YNGTSTSEYQYVYQQLTNNTLVAKNFYSYFGYTSLSDGINALRKLLESLRDDTKLGDNVKRYLKRNDFFTNDRVGLYFAKKERKGKQKITTETMLNMANQRLNLATEVVHKNVLNHLGKEANNLEENENNKQKEVTSSTHLNNNMQTKDFPCYLEEIPPHAEYPYMGKDWIMDDTDCTSQISDDHWDKIIIPFLTKHKLKNAFSTEDDEQTLINMFEEENKKKLLEPGNLNLIYSLTDIEEDTIKVLEI